MARGGGGVGWAAQNHHRPGQPLPRPGARSDLVGVRRGHNASPAAVSDRIGRPPRGGGWLDTDSSSNPKPRRFSGRLPRRRVRLAAGARGRRRPSALVSTASGL